MENGVMVISIPSPNEALPPPPNPAHHSGGAVENPSEAVDTRQPLELPVDKTGQAAGQRDPSQQDSTSKGAEAEKDKVQLPEPSNSSITYRILKELDHLVQSRVVNRDTGEIIRSVPKEKVVEFYEEFRKLNAKIDLEA